MSVSLLINAQKRMIGLPFHPRKNARSTGVRENDTNVKIGSSTPLNSWPYLNNVCAVLAASAGVIREALVELGSLLHYAFRYLAYCLS